MKKLCFSILAGAYLSFPLFAADGVTMVSFVEDATAGGSCRTSLPAFRALLQSELNKAGFEVMRPEDSLTSADAVEGTGRGYGTDGVTKLGDAVQISRNLGSDFYLWCSVTDFSTLEIAPGVVETTLGAAISVNRSGRSDGAYGETFSAKNRNTVEHARGGTSAIQAKLFLEVAQKAAQSISGQMDKFKAIHTRLSQVTFNVFADTMFAMDAEKSDKPKVNALVMVDGFYAGTANIPIPIENGIHKVRIEYPLCDPIEKSIVIKQDQVFNMDLSLLDNGASREKDAAFFKLAYQSADDAIAMAKRKFGTEQLEAKAKIEILKKESRAAYAKVISKLKIENRRRLSEEELAKTWVETLAYAVRKDADARQIAESGEADFLSESYWQSKSDIKNNVSQENAPEAVAGETKAEVEKKAEGVAEEAKTVNNEFSRKSE